MLHVALLEPEIAPNTGNIARLCAATDTTLHLIGRLGFRLDDRALRRAGVDYWDHVKIVRHVDWASFAAAMARHRLLLFTARRGANYTAFQFAAGDCLVFGCESMGLPDTLLNQPDAIVLRIPMRNEAIRSLNLATAAGIAVYEALRQLQP